MTKQTESEKAAGVLTPEFSRARLIGKGRLLEDFAEGQVFRHHWGRTISGSENSIFTTLTLAYNPLYFNVEYAQSEGHRAILVNPLLVFNTIFGLSVEDLSEAGGAFLGVDDLTFHMPVYIGDTLYAESTVISARASRGRPGFGIASWRTVGLNQNGDAVVEFTRTNLVKASEVRR